MQRIIEAVQAALYRYGGALNKFLADDKGTTLIAAFNLPMPAAAAAAAAFFSHHPTRAVASAVDARDALRAVGVRSSIGVTTGVAFAGVVGGAERKEYTIIGDSVNLAARLMQAAQGRVLVDVPTYQEAHAKETLAFTSLPALRVKGKAKPVALFHVTAARAPSSSHDHTGDPAPLTTPRGSPTKLVDDGPASAVLPLAADGGAAAPTLYGRSRHVQLLGELLAELAEGPPGSGGGRAVVMEGSAGMGKSRLCHEVADLARCMQMPVCWAAGDMIDRTPLRAFADLTRQLADVLEHAMYYARRIDQRDELPPPPRRTMLAGTVSPADDEAAAATEGAAVEEEASEAPTERLRGDSLIGGGPDNASPPPLVPMPSAVEEEAPAALGGSGGSRSSLPVASAVLQPLNSFASTASLRDPSARSSLRPGGGAAPAPAARRRPPPPRPPPTPRPRRRPPPPPRGRRRRPTAAAFQGLVQVSVWGRGGAAAAGLPRPPPGDPALPPRRIATRCGGGGGGGGGGSCDADVANVASR